MRASYRNKNYGPCPSTLPGQGETDWIESEPRGHFWLVSIQNATTTHKKLYGQINNYTVNWGVCIWQVVQSALHLLRLDYSRLNKPSEFIPEYWASLQLHNCKEEGKTNWAFFYFHARKTNRMVRTNHSDY